MNKLDKIDWEDVLPVYACGNPEPAPRSEPKKTLVVPPGGTLIGVLVDRSGSMAVNLRDMQAGLNDFIDSQARQPGAAVMLAEFDSTYEVVWPMRPLTRPAPRYTLVPRGQTALLDGIGRFIGDINDTLGDETEYRPVIVCVITDGAENSSKEWDRPAVRAWVNHQRDVYRWEFVFLGANIDAILEGESLGVPRESTLTYDTKHAKRTYELLDKHVSTLRAGHTAAFTDADRRKAIGQ